jgi:glycerophosphoryl diester phosphodiesterase
MWLTGTGKHVGMGAALALWAMVILACGQARLPVRQQPPGRDFLIIGHRGAPHQACENTLESFETALQLGANALELDMSMTSDQHVVLWHDWVMSIKSELRPTGVCRVLRPPLGQSIHEVPLHELVRDYGYEQAGQRVPILTFTEFVQRLGQDDRARLFFLDLKIPEDRPDLVPPLFQHAVQTLQQYHALDKAVFLTPYETVFHQLRHEAQRWYQTTHARVAIAFDTEGPELIQLSAWPSAVRRNQRAGTRFAFWGEPVVTIQSWRDFLVAELRRRDAVNATRPPQARMRFIVWTVNDSSDLCALVGAGVDGIMTDDPGHLHAIVQHWGQPGNCPLLHSESTSSQAGTAGALP